MIWYFRLKGMEQVPPELYITCYDENYDTVDNDKETDEKLHALFCTNTYQDFCSRCKGIQDLLIENNIKHIDCGSQVIYFDHKKKFKLKDYKMQMSISYLNSICIEYPSDKNQHDYNTFKINNFEEAIKAYKKQEPIPKLKFTKDQIDKFQQDLSNKNNINIHQVNDLKIDFNNVLEVEDGILEVEDGNKDIIEKYLQTQINYIFKICQLLDNNQTSLMRNYTYLNGISFHITKNWSDVSITNYISLAFQPKNKATLYKDRNSMIGSAFDRDWKKMYCKVLKWIKTLIHPEDQPEINEEEQNNLIQEEEKKNNSSSDNDIILNNNQQQPQFPLQQQLQLTPQQLNQQIQQRQQEEFLQLQQQQQQQKKRKDFLKKLGIVCLVMLMVCGLEVLVKYNKK